MEINDGVPGAWVGVPGARVGEPGACVGEPGTRVGAPGAWVGLPGAHAHYRSCVLCDVISIMHYNGTIHLYLLSAFYHA